MLGYQYASLHWLYLIGNIFVYLRIVVASGVPPTLSCRLRLPYILDLGMISTPLT